ncbi:MAG: hypothetical protein AAFO77_10480 [Pseudomonadota bacterium]
MKKSYEKPLVVKKQSLAQVAAGEVRVPLSAIDANGMAAIYQGMF